jgi:hypothetical protein
MARNDNDGATRLGARNGRDGEYDETRETNRNVATDGRRAHEGEARDKFGGVNIGASFFGWIVAIGIAILLTSIVGAIGSAVGFSGNLSQTDAERQAGTIGIIAAVVLLLVLMIAYYAGGYVAGRMSRFDGGRQGFMVWLIGLLVTIAAAVLGTVFGSQYNILDRVSLPRLPVSLDQIGWGALITAVAVVLLTLLAAVMGGKVGHRYHDRVDRAARR